MALDQECKQLAEEKFSLLEEEKEERNSRYSVLLLSVFEQLVF